MNKSPSSKYRYVVIMRHGTKQEMKNRYDLPLVSESKRYCQNQNTFKQVASKLKKSPNKKVIYSSPFLRTKQTAGRFAKKIDYQNPIRVHNGLGESYSSVVKELNKCGENEYKIPKQTTHIDKCLLSTLDKKEIKNMVKSVDELDKYKFCHVEKQVKSPKNKREQDCNFKKTVCQIIKNNPDKDIVIVTHGRNVRKSPNILSSKTIVTNPRTCGSVLYKQTKGNNKFDIDDYHGLFML